MPLSSEEQRLEALCQYDILDSPPETTFDLITSMVSEILQVPHSCVSLVDRERVWFKSAAGVDAPEVPRELGFCSTLVISDEDVRHIEDAASHPETQSNSLVCGPPNIRFYAGAPLLTTEGHRIGTLCAFGPEPRDLTLTERATLKGLTALVMNEIELRRTRQQLSRTEEALRKAQKLESIGLVASGVAHDFNNLLGGILGHAELLRHEVRDHPECLNLLREIETTGQRASDLAGQVLAYVGRGEDIPLLPVNLNALVEETHHLVASSLETRARIHLKLGAGLPAVPAQSTGLRQLVLNLLTNASEACAETRGNVWISTRAEARRVILTVRDDGHGMAPEARDRIFQPFVSSKTGGRGLGLAICHRVVEQHGGTIRVESELGHGTTFVVTLPTCPESPSPAEGLPEAEDSPAGEGRVLVVDDEPIIRELARRGLERVGYEVLVADGGQEALDILEEHALSLGAMVLDWSMPGVDGEQVLSTMKARGWAVPVVLSSGHSVEDAMDRTAGFSVTSFLKKPYRLNELELKVEEALAPLRVGISQTVS